ncbi:MAG: hypothetical protein ACRD35_04695, partial [Candidatus Acidiferrales bacterium]
MRSLTVLRQKSPRSKSTFPTALRRLGAALVGVALGFGLVGCGVGATVLPGNLPPVGGGAGIAIVTFDTVDGVLGRVYEKHIETSGTTPPIIACTILTGALPPGLTVVTGEDFTPADVTDDDECIITGTPTTLGTFGFVLEGRDSALISSTDEEDFTITIRQEFQITSFDVVDAVAGRDYFKAFKVFTNLSNNPTPTEIASTERGNGPIVACNILGLPANMSFTCVPDGTGLAVDVTLFNSGVLAASGPLALTIEITDSDIVQTARVVVVGRPLSNATTSPSFAVGFTIRAEFTITSAVPLLPEGTQTGPYNQVVSVTTNLTDNANDVGQAGESGNGPVTDCVINGLPTNLSSSFVLTGGGTGCDITIDGGTITDLIGLYTLSLVVSDSDILQAAAIVVNLSSQVQNPTLNVNGPLAFTLSTVDAGTTNACTGGTFADASNVAPDAVLGRTYGGPARCDLLFTATGGSGPMVWTQNSVGFLVCTIESINPSDNRLLRCNSAGAGASGATFALDVEVTDNNSTNVTQDVNTHTSHTLNVRAALTLTPATATANAPPPGVQSRTYGDTGAGFTALVYNAANGLAPFVFTLPASVGAPAVNGVPANVACVSAATSATCSSGVNPVTAAVGNYPFTVTVNDTQNDTTPSGNAPVARSIDI